MKLLWTVLYDRVKIVVLQERGTRSRIALCAKLNINYEKKKMNSKLSEAKCCESRPRELNYLRSKNPGKIRLPFRLTLFHFIPIFAHFYVATDNPAIHTRKRVHVAQYDAMTEVGAKWEIHCKFVDTSFEKVGKKNKCQWNERIASSQSLLLSQWQSCR